MGGGAGDKSARLLEQPRQQAPLYRSPAGEAAVRAVYDRALAALPHPHKERYVDTSFGTAHVVECGPEDAPPLVVLHGMGAPAPFMLGMLLPLVESGRFRIFCPDQPLQCGSRTQDAELDPAKHEHGKWCLEVLTELGLVGPAASGPPPFVVGVSFGAAVLLDLAVVAPEVIRGAALVVPGGLVPINRWAVLFGVVLPSILYRLVPCRLTEWLAVRSMFDEPEADLDIVFLSWRHIARHPQLPGGPSGFTPDQLRNFRSPTLVAAERDVFWSGKAAAAAAKLSIPGCDTWVIPGAKHLPAKHHLREMNRMLMDLFVGEPVVGQEQAPAQRTAE